MNDGEGDNDETTMTKAQQRKPDNKTRGINTPEVSARRPLSREAHARLHVRTHDACIAGMRSWPGILFPVQEDTGLGGKGGGRGGATRGAKNGFGATPYFLVIADDQKG